MVIDLRLNSQSYREEKERRQKTSSRKQVTAQQPRASTITVGWICWLFPEIEASKAMLDEKYSEWETQERNDNAEYVLGRIGKHNVVMVWLKRSIDLATDRKVANMALHKLTADFISLRFITMGWD